MEKYDVLKLLLVSCDKLNCFTDEQIRWLYAQMDLQIDLLTQQMFYEKVKSSN